MKLIDKDALLNRMQKDPLFDLVERYGVSGVINAEPTVDAEPVRHGHWEIYVISPFDGEDVKCSECGERGCAPYWNYCPNCGAKMDGTEREEE